MPMSFITVITPVIPEKKGLKAEWLHAKQTWGAPNSVTGSWVNVSGVVTKVSTASLSHLKKRVEIVANQTA